MTASLPSSTVDKAERNATIIEALAAHGTMAAAARAAECDPRTVSRLIANHSAAAEAFEVGVAALYQRRVAKYATRLHEAQQALGRTNTLIDKHRQQIVDDFPTMTMVALQKTERTINGLLATRARQESALKQAKHRLDYARRRAELVTGEKAS